MLAIITKFERQNLLDTHSCSRMQSGPVCSVCGVLGVLISGYTEEIRNYDKMIRFNINLHGSYRIGSVDSYIGYIGLISQFKMTSI